MSPAPRRDGTSRPRTAVLHADYGSAASYLRDWLDAFRASPEFDVTAFDIVRRSGRAALARRLGEFELVVLLHSVVGDTQVYAQAILPMLQARPARLLAFVGNEVNLPQAPIATKLQYLAAAQPDFIATQLLLEAGEYLYRDVGATVISVPHALNPAAFRPEVPLADRTIDVGVRGFTYLPHLGDDDRNRLYELFSAHAFDPRLRVDVASEPRFTRPGWATFLNRCRGTVASEAGSWYLERDDATVRRIQEWWQEQRPGGPTIGLDSPLRRLGHRLPWRVKERLARILRRGPIRDERAALRALDFETVHRLFFEATPPAPVYSKAVSSRHFDAAGTRTCQILLWGRYNDIFLADEHYLALDADHGNIDDVMTRFHDDAHVENMTARTREYVLDGHTHAHRLADLRKQLD